MANDIKFEDFPASPTGFLDAYDFYDSFLKCEELAKQVPKKELGQNPDYSFYQLLKEIHSAKSDNPALFRKRTDAEEALTRLWLSRVREKANLFVAYNNVPTFPGLSPDDLVKIGKASSDESNLLKIGQILLDLGIVLVYERSIPGMKLDGAVFRLGTGNPAIALSLRYPRLDHFWFTLMHELAHVSLHSETLSTPILDDMDAKTGDLIEKQADRLAGASLISRSAWRSCQAMYSQNDDEVRSFAAQVGVHPAIVAGRIRNELNRYDLFTKIIHAVDVRKILLGDE